MDHDHGNLVADVANRQDLGSSPFLNGSQEGPIQFASSRLALLSVLEISQSYRRALEDDSSLARLLNVPLMSDILAERVGCLFSNSRPHVLEIEEGACDDISWMDVVRESPFRAEQEAEHYRFHLRNQKAIIKLSQFDYDLISSGIPRQLVRPQSHANDMIAEINTVDVLTSEMVHWKNIAVDRKRFLSGCSSLTFAKLT